MNPSCFFIFSDNFNIFIVLSDLHTPNSVNTCDEGGEGAAWGRTTIGWFILVLASIHLLTIGQIEGTGNLSVKCIAKNNLWNAKYKTNQIGCNVSLQMLYISLYLSLALSLSVMFTAAID